MLKKVLLVVLIVYSLFSTMLLISQSADIADLESKLSVLENQGESIDETTSEDNKSNVVNVAAFDAEKVIESLNIEEIHYESKYSNYAFLIIENTSDYNIQIDVEAKFYNQAGELVGAKNESEVAFEKGYEMVIRFSVDEAFEKMEYEITVDEEDYYDCVISDLEYETVSAKNKEIVSVKNNGDEAADFVETHALFFKNGKVVGFDDVYFVDDESQLKPGKTLTKEMDCYEEYDNVRFFFTGRRY